MSVHRRWMMAAVVAGVAGAMGGVASGGATTSAQPEAEEVDWAAIRQSREDAMARLAPLVGEWKAEGTLGTPDEAGERAVQRGTWSNRWIFENKHLELSFDVQVGDPAEDRWSQWVAIVSYNPFREQYETVWVGSGGYRFAETGNFDEEGRLVLTSAQDGPDLENPTINVSVFEFNDDGSVTVTDTQTNREQEEPVMSFYAELRRE